MDEIRYKDVQAQNVVIESESDSDGHVGTVTGTICTGCVDRDNEVIVPGGVDLVEFRKNPVVLFAHDKRSEPVAKALWIRHDKQSDSIIAKIAFAATQRGREIFKLMKDGFLNAFSVGFDPRTNSDFGEPTTKEIQMRPELAGVSTIFRKIPLTEFSVVPVPANPQALAFAVGKGMEMSEYVAKAFKMDGFISVNEAREKEQDKQEEDLAIVTVGRMASVMVGKKVARVRKTSAPRLAIEKRANTVVARHRGRVLFEPVTDQA